MSDLHDEIVAIVYKHLPGKHDQKTHGRRGAGDVVSSLKIGDKPTKIKSDNHSVYAELKKHRNGVYSLKLGERVRWGNRREIRKDLQHFHDFGTLPKSKGQSWA